MSGKWSDRQLHWNLPNHCQIIEVRQFIIRPEMYADFNALRPRTLLVGTWRIFCFGWRGTQTVKQWVLQCFDEIFHVGGWNIEKQPGKGRHIFPNQVLKCLKDLQIWLITPWKQTYPLKKDGWKMIFPFKMIPFQDTFVHFRGGKVWFLGHELGGLEPFHSGASVNKLSWLIFPTMFPETNLRGFALCAQGPSKFIHFVFSLWGHLLRTSSELLLFYTTFWW